MPENIQLMELSTLFWNLVRKISKEWNRREKDYLSFSQFRMLYMLNCGGPQKVSDLAEALSITSGGVTGLADKLIEAGFVERDRAEDDRRVVIINITDHGKDMMNLMLEKHKEMVAAFFEGLPDDDVTQLYRILSQVLEKAERQFKE